MRPESHRALAFAVNGVAPGIVGQAVKRSGVGALVVHYGTDYVFSGRSGRPYREDAPTEPFGAFGESNLAGEGALAATGAPYVILRTQWLFGLNGRSFPRTMWTHARSGRATRVVNDQVGRPTGTVDLARATWLLIRLKDEGIQQQPAETIHVANNMERQLGTLLRRVSSRRRASRSGSRPARRLSTPRRLDDRITRCWTLRNTSPSRGGHCQRGKTLWTDC